MNPGQALDLQAENERLKQELKSTYEFLSSVAKLACRNAELEKTVELMANQISQFSVFRYVKPLDPRSIYDEFLLKAQEALKGEDK